MPRGNGGVIGPANIPTTSVAKGVWSLMEQQLAQRQGIWPAGPLGFDPYFEYTTLLLPGNGTNGAQNNTFLDGSTNNFTITRNGNTTQGTFSPFSQTGWGNYFSGSSQYLSFTDTSNNLDLGGSQASFECWVYPISTTNYQILFKYGGTGDWNTTNGIEYGLSLQSGVVYFYYNSSASAASINSGATTVSANTWTHIAVASNASNALSIYVNGTRVATTTAAITKPTTRTSMRIGVDISNYANGYMSNYRFITGSNAYDATLSSINVPTSPVSAVTGTQLLTCQSNRFRDASTNNFTITVNGSPSVQAFSPFNPTASWSAATYGGSGYFDGNGDYLSVASSGAQPQGTEDWCIEMWIYLTTISTTTDTPWIEVSTNNGVQIYTTTSGTVLAFGIYGIGSVTTYTLPSGITNAWNHFVFTRSSNAWRLMHNGVLRANGTSSASLSTGTMSIFSRGASNYSTGYCGLTRVVRASIPTEYQTSSTTNGTSIYTVPTAPATTTSQGATSGDVELLLTFTNAGIYDATSKNDLETVGNAQISTTQSKWGGSSMAFDGTGDYLATLTGTFLNLSGDFTIEGWVYLNSSSANVGFFSNGDFPSTAQVATDVGSGAPALFISNGSGWAVNISSTQPISILTWTHVAYVCSGSTLKIFVNGVQGASATYSGTRTTPSSTSVLGRLYVSTNNYYLNGYIQDFRITKGYARYTSNFTPPTAAFPTL